MHLWLTVNIRLSSNPLIVKEPKQEAVILLVTSRCMWRERRDKQHLVDIAQTLICSIQFTFMAVLHFLHIALQMHADCWGVPPVGGLLALQAG